jgi:23S rRNA (cytidine2498-2'-O)-methyltransferase
MVDRSEPDKGLFKRFPALKYYRGDGLNPPAELLKAATFLLSDMACEPEKLLLAVKKWLNADRLKAMVCTLKFHGLSDKKIIGEFAAIPGGTLYHLWHNGHELTWVWLSTRVL